MYSEITPITEEVESIHKYLIKSKDSEAKAYENFITGIDLSYISNVREKDDGITWSYNIRNREFSDNYKQLKESSDADEKNYFRM